MCGINASRGQGHGCRFTMCHASLKMALLLHKVGLVSRLMSTTVGRLKKAKSLISHVLNFRGCNFTQYIQQLLLVSFDFREVETMRYKMFHCILKYPISMEITVASEYNKHIPIHVWIVVRNTLVPLSFHAASKQHFLILQGSISVYASMQILPFSVLFNMYFIN